MALPRNRFANTTPQSQLGATVLPMQAGFSGRATTIPAQGLAGPSATKALTEFFGNLGERDGIRTHDLLIKSQLLYRLSYALPRAGNAALEIARNIGRVDRPVNRKKMARKPCFSRPRASRILAPSTAEGGHCGQARRIGL
ncbi:hypothetical protein MPLB_180087 [Mesorhizobium sp. ORS 3324]|nr:hypothetical protein MPLB_180087 [Mesorhizobium sp. ORS 3324]